MDVSTDDIRNVGYCILKELYKSLEIDKFWNRKNVSIPFLKILLVKNKLDLQVLGVTHWGTAWDYVSAQDIRQRKKQAEMQSGISACFIFFCPQNRVYSTFRTMAEPFIAKRLKRVERV